MQVQNKISGSIFLCGIIIHTRTHTATKQAEFCLHYLGKKKKSLDFSLNCYTLNILFFCCCCCLSMRKKLISFFFCTEIMRQPSPVSQKRLVDSLLGLLVGIFNKKQKRKTGNKKHFRINVRAVDGWILQAYSCNLFKFGQNFGEELKWQFTEEIKHRHSLTHLEQIGK